MTKTGNLAKTGPKTLQGKIAVSTNASTHGILSVKPVVTIYESQDQWRAHRKAIMEALEPKDGIEQALADRVASCSWRLNRVLFFEAETITEQQENLVDEMRKDQRRYSSLYPSDEVDFDAVEEAEKHRAIYEDVVGVYRESIDELASHNTMPCHAVGLSPRSLARRQSRRLSGGSSLRGQFGSRGARRRLRRLRREDDGAPEPRHRCHGAGDPGCT